MSGFLLDTPVLAETFKPVPSAGVLEWIADQRAGALYLTTMTLGELIRGVRARALWPDGAELERWINQDLTEQFEGRILPFDAESAALWGAMVAELDAKPRAAAELQVAAVALKHDFTLVTTNAKAFKGTKVKAIEPVSG